MSIFCGLAGHQPEQRATYNSGFYFSRCRRCRRDMIRSGEDWQTVPGGHRVVWRSGRGVHSIEPDYDKVMAILLNPPQLPAVRPAFLSWSRQLVRIGSPAAATRADAAAEAEAREDGQYPMLLVVAALFAAGVQMLLGFGARPRDYA